ncbi:hypothetical protein KUCAC02_003715, partial [Chaenocephalus aceratus]
MYRAPHLLPGPVLSRALAVRWVGAHSDVSARTYSVTRSITLCSCDSRASLSGALPVTVECKKAQPKEVMFPPGTRGRARGLPYTMDAFMLGMGMLSYPNIVATYGRGYTGFAPSYSYQFP